MIKKCQYLACSEIATCASTLVVLERQPARLLCVKHFFEIERRVTPRYDVSMITLFRQARDSFREGGSDGLNSYIMLRASDLNIKYRRRTRGWATKKIKDSIGYMCAYLGREGADLLKYFQDWAGIQHPDFGSAEQMLEMAIKEEKQEVIDKEEKEQIELDESPI